MFDQLGATRRGVMGMAAAALAATVAARDRTLNPMSVAAIDASLYVKFALREDGAGLGGVDIAQGKARAANDEAIVLAATSGN